MTRKIRGNTNPRRKARKATGKISSGVRSLGRGIKRVATHPASMATYKAIGRSAGRVIEEAAKTGIREVVHGGVTEAGKEYKRRQTKRRNYKHAKDMGWL